MSRWTILTLALLASCGEEVINLPDLAPDLTVDQGSDALSCILDRYNGQWKPNIADFCSGTKIDCSKTKDTGTWGYQCSGCSCNGFTVVENYCENKRDGVKCGYWKLRISDTCKWKSDWLDQCD